MIREFINHNDLHYPILVFLLFVIPKFLIRWRIPGAISAFLIGVLSQYFDWKGFEGDATVYWISTFGITSLFLYAGMEVDFDEIYKNWKVVLQHLSIRFFTMLLLSYWLVNSLDLSYISGVLIAIGLVGPSTGFIIDSLSSNRQLSDQQKNWIRLLSISTEILAVLMMLVAVQLNQPILLITNIGTVLMLIFFLPRLVSVFARFVAPFAPQSEFGFLIMVAIIAGLLTKKMGTYYIVGAFIVGISAHQFRKYLPIDDYHQMGRAVSFFSSFFIPFYFFKEGARLNLEQISSESIQMGFLIFLVGLALRVPPLVLHRIWALKSTWKEEIKISIALVPTLIFGFVICDLLRIYDLASAKIVNSVVISTLLFSMTPFLYNVFTEKSEEHRPKLKLTPK